MARSKPNPHIVESREQAEGTMAEIAALDRKLAALTVSMNKELDAAKEKAAQAAAMKWGFSLKDGYFSESGRRHGVL